MEYINIGILKLVNFRPNTSTNTSVWVLADTEYRYGVVDELVLKLYTMTLETC